ncbi:MAG: efflux RND transporter periplasmic adaptor subunit [Steroidobacteraceae bacterium]
MANSDRRILVRTVVIVAVVLVIIFGIKLWQERAAQAARTHHGPFMVSVTAAPVAKIAWQPEIHVVASLVATAGVALTPQLSGQVTGIYFHSGEYVHRGQRLVQIDDSNQLATLAQDLAAEALARINYQRDQHLYAARATSREILDTAHANLESATATVANVRATLAKLSVSAPFAGWMGVRDISLGQYLSPGTEIAALNVWNPVRAEFTVPQNSSGLIHPGQTVDIAVDAFPGRSFAGRITAVDSDINPNTRNVTVEAVIPNPHLLLRPGMFGEASVMVGAAQARLAVPTVAITYSTFGDYVYVIEKRKAGPHTLQVAIATPIRPGHTRGKMTAVLHGLHAGELVVTAGQIKLRSGMPVAIKRPGAH